MIRKHFSHLSFGGIIKCIAFVLLLLLGTILGAQGQDRSQMTANSDGSPAPGRVLDLSKVTRSLSDEHLSAILYDLKVGFEKKPLDGKTLFVLTGKNATIFNEGGLIQCFGTINKSETATLERLNLWNNSHHFANASLDEEGNPQLTVELGLQSGVTLATVHRYALYFFVALDEFNKEFGK